jgi:hypothetical protein
VITIDWRATGSRWKRRSRTSCRNLSFCSVTFRKTGSNSWSACPILLTALVLSLVNLPWSSTASSSRKYRTLSPEVRKYSSPTWSRSPVVNLVYEPHHVGRRKGSYEYTHEGVIVQDELVKELLGASQQGINILGGYEFRNNEISDPDIQLCSV